MKKRTIDLTHGPIVKQLLLFSLPLMLSAVINVFYGIADQMVLGRYVGDNAMAAAGSTGAPFNLVYNLFVGLSLGVTVLCGQMLGERDEKRIRRCMHTTVFTGALVGLFVCIVGLLLSRPIMMVMKTPADILEDAVLYFRIRFVGTPFTMLCAFYEAVMMAHGDTRPITVIGMVCGLVNVLLNLLFVLVFKLEIVGVALATLLSKLADCACKSIIMFSPRNVYGLRFRELKPDRKMFGKILAIGIPNGLNSTVFSFANTLLQSTVNSFGSVVIAANAAAGSVENLINVAYTGVPRAVVPAVSQCYGAKNFKRMKEIVNKSVLLCVSMISVFAAAMIPLRRQMLGLFTETPEVIEAGIPKLVLMAIGYVIHTFGHIYGSGLKGLQKSGYSLVMNFVGVCAPRVLWVWFVIPLLPTPYMLYIIYPISWTISSVWSALAFARIRRQEEKKYLAAIA